ATELRGNNESRVWQLPPTDAGGWVNLTFSLAEGATLVPPALALSVPLEPQRGADTVDTFQVSAEDGTEGVAVSITFSVALSEERSWRLTLSGGGESAGVQPAPQPYSRSLDSASSGPSSTLLHPLPYDLADTPLSLAFTLPPGATLEPPQLP